MSSRVQLYEMNGEKLSMDLMCDLFSHNITDTVEYTVWGHTEHKHYSV